MLFRQRQLEGIADGSVTLVFRRWDKARVRAGARQLTSAGVIVFDAVDVVDDVTEDEMRRAGVRSRAEALGDGRPGTLYRIALHLEGPDPRVALREGSPTPEDFERLARLPWALDYLRAIAERPGVRAADLADSFGIEKLKFKARVRRLKELGMTESLSPGYRLSPRGEAVLERQGARTEPGPSVRRR